MAEQTYAEARGVGLVAGAMLALTLIVAATFIWIGLTTGPAPTPGASTAATTAEPAAAPAAN